MDKFVDFWTSSAKKDFETAMVLYDQERFDWCLFIGHLYLEKLLKAKWIEDNGSQDFPRSHNLLLIAKGTSLNIDDEKENLLRKITGFNLEVRYPDYKETFYKICTKEFAEKHFNLIKELGQWVELTRK